jgi:hypothetical protein
MAFPRPFYGIFDGFEAGTHYCDAKTRGEAAADLTPLSQGSPSSHVDTLGDFAMLRSLFLRIHSGET